MKRENAGVCSSLAPISEQTLPGEVFRVGECPGYSFQWRSLLG